MVEWGSHEARPPDWLIAHAPQEAGSIPGALEAETRHSGVTVVRRWARHRQAVRQEEGTRTDRRQQEIMAAKGETGERTRSRCTAGMPGRAGHGRVRLARFRLQSTAQLSGAVRDRRSRLLRAVLHHSRMHHRAPTRQAQRRARGRAGVGTEARGRGLGSYAAGRGGEPAGRSPGRRRERALRCAHT